MKVRWTPNFLFRFDIHSFNSYVPTPVQIVHSHTRNAKLSRAIISELCDDDEVKTKRGVRGCKWWWCSFMYTAGRRVCGICCLDEGTQSAYKPRK